MSRTNLSMSISADGYVAGPDQSAEHPLGRGGEQLHGWHLGPAKDHPANRQVVSEMLDDMGATIMGRNMFGPVRGDWAGSGWTGWWGDVPPYHCPVFVLTHYPHEPIELRGGTTFHFVTDGIESAYARARDATGDRPISIAGGASCARQAIRAALVDEIDLQVNPVILGSGERLFDGLPAGEPGLELVRVLEAPGVAHLRYRVIR
ncbi:dihydrofolate reductase family protein [Mycobacterium paragordonae]|uniref:Dihydrofolate reductase family protein n=1 Tax=Mycobacterium paragordonae TaxID=1389713 RepID=A0A4R5WT96_9MYCO|nr:dihydrofolate reductase family protein [Mycobacterium paragordonae]MDP7733422.1 dihydrofolate reductase family protein [Mycobacterium paragordonae]TDK96034.1 dihydrofolate reductase [Mycobacterium paragordonae]TDL07906.1 dihydrofolate reductase [Mycobacterium paragordonae]